MAKSESRSPGPTQEEEAVFAAGEDRGDGGEPVVIDAPAPTADRATSLTPAPVEAQSSEQAFPVVGIGASAGGLAAIERFCAALSPDTEEALAIVLVQHLDPDRPSLLSDLILKYTRMRTQLVTDGMAVERGNFYIIPPGRDIALEDGRLRLLEPTSPRGQRLPIDFFLRSLARERGRRAVAVILSGTGADGTLGLKAVKEAGGLVIAQQPETAQYDGMPRSAIATGLVDYVLPPDEMPGRLMSYLRRAPGEDVPGAGPTGERQPRPTEPLQRIFALLRARVGHDFSRYKRNTITRRIERRMALHQLDSHAAYVRFLEQSPTEVNTLFRELLIGVTNFFRDPEAFESLQERVIPAIFGNKQSGDTIRVWIPACSTGEEAYSIAILLQEHLSQLAVDIRVQVFATDIDGEAIEQARAATYPSSITADIAAPRVQRYFDQANSAIRVKRFIRDMVIFAEQNVLEDPPFSRLDLISCRNLLIYLSAELQRRALSTFHYALNPHGYLFLGSSETVAEFGDMFSTVNHKWKIFVRNPAGGQHRPNVDLARRNIELQPMGDRGRLARDGSSVDVRLVIEQVLLAQHTPASVIVTASGEIVYVHGRTGYYLEPASGDASLNILRMARDPLRVELTAALRKAVASQVAVTQRALGNRVQGGTQVVDVTVRPFVEAGPAGLYLVVFQPGPPQAVAAEESPELEPAEKDGRILALEHELRSKEEHLQAAIEELETANEELMSTNEELQSSNEELQSTNEELETSKEELQSVNEELLTVNMELQKRIEELSRANDELNNLLASTGIGTLFVDRSLHIQRFTPAVTAIVNLIQTDIGRPVSHIASNFVNYPDLVRDLTAVVDNLIAREREVQLRTGQWYLMRIQPYRSQKNLIDGAVVTFVDITTQVTLQAALAESQRLRVETVSDPVLVVNQDSKVVDASAAAVRLFGHTRERLLELRAVDLVRNNSVGILAESLTDAERGVNSVVELCLRLADGSRIQAEARMRRVDSGNTWGVFIVLRAIDARPENDPVRRSSAARPLEAFMRDLRHPVLVFDPDGQILALNAAAERWYGWSEAQVAGQPVEELMPEAHRSRHREALALLLEGKEVEPYDSERLTPAGSALPVLVTAFALVDAQRGPYAVASVEHPR
jgi:two-component system, chemotaxis family, CheB/CheR fusion protein